MCGRYSLTTPGAVLADVFELGAAPALEPRYNIAPTQPAPVVRLGADGRRAFDSLRWGLVPPWAPDLKNASRAINARVESLAQRPAFRESFEARRCLVPADGFYEWKAAGGRKQPFWIHRPDRAPLAFAGLWSIWHAQPTPAGVERVETFTIVTRDASAALAEIHERMPLILPPEAWSAWLEAGRYDARELRALLDAGRPETDELIATPVGPRVNGTAYDGPECWAAPPPEAGSQLELFG